MTEQEETNEGVEIDEIESDPILSEGQDGSDDDEDEDEPESDEDARGEL
jgi:hypothetical protein